MYGLSKRGPYDETLTVSCSIKKSINDDDGGEDTVGDVGSFTALTLLVGRREGCSVVRKNRNKQRI